MNRLMWYSGSKINFSEKFNEIIKNESRPVYIESFLGSGAIFCNLEKEFEEYRLNDKNEDIITVWEFIKKYNYGDLMNIFKEVKEKFGDIKTNKESYYNFRNYYNSNYWRTDKPEKGGYLYFIINSTINSLARFGPNGFNNSYGNRLYILSENEFNIINSRLQRSILTSIDYTELNYDDSIAFLDPPYFERKSSYKENFSESKLVEFLTFLEKIDLYVYTDMLSETHKEISNKINVIRQMKSTRPGKTAGQITGSEIYITNIIEGNWNEYSVRIFKNERILL